LDLSYRKVGQPLGFAKSTLCKWLKQEPAVEGSLRGEVVELDGLWTRTGAGREELKVARDDPGAVFLSFGEWEQVVEGLYARGLGEPAHMISDGDPAIAGAIELVYGTQVPHQLCQFHYLREAARPIYEADRHAKKELKKRVRDIRALERKLDCKAQKEPEGVEAEVSRASCAAVRSALTDDGL
jgi:hypothetical protein